MGERRKRRTLWDKEAETKHFSGTSENNCLTGKEHLSSHDSGHYQELYASGSYREPNFSSGQPSLESIEENLVAPTNGSFIRSKENAPDGKKIGDEDRYYQKMSPGFKYNHSIGSDRSHSQRYLRRGRSRSRSRTRGRSRSRSMSRSRERERPRGRSRSRSRGDGSSRDRITSRSPKGDYGHQSYGWSDRRSLSEKSTEICSNFAAGRCRRGSQCKFFHSNDISHRDGDLVGADISESGIRAEHGHIFEQSYSSRGPRTELRGDVSDLHHGEDVQFQNKSRSAVPCKDFMKGKCIWGDTCRFSHHFTPDENFGKSTGCTSSEKDSEQYKIGKPLCKYFAARKCDLNNCRFSHENSKFNSPQRKVTDDDSSHDKGKKLHGPTWSDATTDNVKPCGWDESIITDASNNGGKTNAESDYRWSHNLRNKNRNWRIPELTDNLIGEDNHPSPPAGSGSYGRDLGTVESISEESMANKQELLMLHGSQLQNQDGNSNDQGHNKMQLDQSFSMKAQQLNVSQVSHIQHHGEAENNLMSSFRSNVLDEVKDSRNATDPILLSGQNLSQNSENVFPGRSSIPIKIDRVQNMPCPNRPNVFGGDLNVAEEHLVANLNLHSQTQNHQQGIQVSGMLEEKVPDFFPNSVASEHSAQFTNSVVSDTGQQVALATNPIMFPTQGFENEYSLKIADIEVSKSVGMVLPFSDASEHVALVKTTNIKSNPIRASHDLINSMENDRNTNYHGNQTEPGNHMRRSSPLAIAGVEPDNSKVHHSGRSKLKQEPVFANPEVDEGKRAICEESEGAKNNKHSETVDGHGKAEESIGNKDDKAMRLFKNSLIEFVKDILKPTWKEGRMSREVYKTIVKKVVDKVTSTIQADHIPKTQDKVEQYLSYSKPKIVKLVQAYVGRCLKTDS